MINKVFQQTTKEKGTNKSSYHIVSDVNKHIFAFIMLEVMRSNYNIITAGSVRLQKLLNDMG